MVQCGIVEYKAVFRHDLAISLVHKIGHIFSAYVMKGNGRTPSHWPFIQQHNEGETGRTLEFLMFGGVSVYSATESAPIIR